MAKSMLHQLVVGVATTAGLHVHTGSLEMDGVEVQIAEGWNRVAWPTHESDLQVRTVAEKTREFCNGFVYIRHCNQIMVADGYGIRAWSEKPSKYGEEEFWVSPVILQSIVALRILREEYNFGKSLSVNHYEEFIKAQLRQVRIIRRTGK